MTHSAQDFLQSVAEANPGETEFLTAVHEVVDSVWDVVQDNKKYSEAKILERVVEPERVISFRVAWLDDKQEVQVNRGYRIQHSSTLGPYKGGLRFHPSVNQSILKFLAFEQTFKNSLTTLPMGGGKGGSNFNPKGKSDAEVMRFCQAFMSELYRHIGANLDVPAGDIGVGGREVGYMFGQYKKLANEFTGVLTGKGFEFGGSRIRPEATGYGLVYFTKLMLENTGHSLKDKKVAVSGSGNVAQYTTEKLIEFGAKVVSMSDSSGTIYDASGIDTEKLAFVMELKNVKRGRIKEYAKQFKGSEYLEGERPWKLDVDLALPCATQGELELEGAKALVDNGCIAVAEGANMPCTPDAIEYLQKKNILFAPGKATNAGGVATSGLEMSQNSLRLQWSREEVDQKLQKIMSDIHEKCVEHGGSGSQVDYLRGANVGGFIKVADAMLAQGVV